MQNPSSILVIKPSSLGDIVHTLPSVHCLRTRWPSAKITWLVKPEWAALLRENPDVDEVIEFPAREFPPPLGWLRFSKWVRHLRERVRPDCVLDFQGLLRSAWIAHGMGAESWGLSDSREGARFFHRHIVGVPPRGQPPHAVERSLALVQALGCDVAGPLVWPLPQGSQPSALTLKPERFVLLHPFSRGAGKSLNAAEVATFCKVVAPFPVLLIGRTETTPTPMPNVIDLLNRTTLPELCWLLRRAAWVVSVDSGPMHIAAAIAPRLLAIHTWSDPRLVGPFHPRAWVWKDGRLGRMSEFPAGEPCGLDQLGAWLLPRLSE